MFRLTVYLANNYNSFETTIKDALSVKQHFHILLNKREPRIHHHITTSLSSQYPKYAHQLEVAGSGVVDAHTKLDDGIHGPEEGVRVHNNLCFQLRSLSFAKCVDISTARKKQPGLSYATLRNTNICPKRIKSIWPYAGSVRNFQTHTDRAKPTRVACPRANCRCERNHNKP